MLRETTCVLVANSDTLSLARRLGAPSAVFMSDLGFPGDSLPSEIPQRDYADQLRLLWVGALRPRKAVRLALEAVREADVPVRLTVMGDGPQERLLEGWIGELGIESRVDWRGRVPWQDVIEAYQTHDALLFTSLRDTAGMQLLEAMAYGLPIIALDHHGVRDNVPEGAGITVEVTTPELTVKGLAEAIRRLYDSPGLRATLGATGYAHAQRHSWSQKARDMSRVYERYLDQ